MGRNNNKDNERKKERRKRKERNYFTKEERRNPISKLIRIQKKWEERREQGLERIIKK